MWYDDDKYKAERLELTNLLTQMSKGRKAGGAVTNQWLETERSIGKSDVFILQDTEAIFQVYLNYAYENKRYFSGADEEKTKFLGNEFIREIVDKIRPEEAYEKNLRMSYRDIVWVVLSTLIQAIGKSKDMRDKYYKYLNPSSHSEEESSRVPEPSKYREPEQSEIVVPKYREASYKKSEEEKSELIPILIPILIGGIILLLLLVKK